mgnify:CR=1 FL=1
MSVFREYSLQADKEQADKAIVVVATLQHYTCLVRSSAKNDKRKTNNQ